MRELEIARSAALAAGRILKEEFFRGSVVKADEGKDIKLAADVLAEQEILRQLRAGSQWPILSEEAGAETGFSTQGRYWVVDPLDGTLNFSKRLPLCCVSIALWENDQPVLGVIHDFIAGQTFTGVVGNGAWKNGESIRVSAVEQPGKAALATGFPSGRNYEEAALLDFVRQVQVYKKVRLLGTAALSLAFVAAGALDAYQEEDIYLWDVAAGLALVKAAGGDYQISPGKKRWQLNVLAHNGRLAVH